MKNINAKETTYHTKTIVAHWFNSNERKAFHNDLIARAEMRNLTIPISMRAIWTPFSPTSSSSLASSLAMTST